MKKHILLLLSIFIFQISNAQIYPENNPVYLDSEVPRINIYLPQDSLIAIYQNLENEYEYHATFVYKSSLINDSILNVGFRLRGNTSLNSEKKSFKISFNTYQAGRKFYGLEKLNLNGEHNDPSIIRSKLSWDIFRTLWVPAPRANHVQVYINGNYYGLYISVEHIDEEFAKSRFDNKSGNLYKCLYPADLQFISNNPDDYKFTESNRRVYELITNEETDDYTDLASFINILNNTNPNDFPTNLEPVFNVDSYLRFLAVECIIGHWDSYSYLKNNYYLYHNTKTDKFEFIPYDTDNTFGIDWFSEDWANRNIYQFANTSEPRPLTIRILQNDLYKKRYTFYVKQLIKMLDPNTLFPKIEQIKNMIRPYAETDIYRTMDYGWNMNDFDNSYNQALGNHVTYGLKPYISTRLNSANQQLNTVSDINLAINEFVASNLTSFADNFGEYDDWIEIINNSTSHIYLGNKYITDNLSQPDKWLMPDITLNPGELLIFWADGTPSQGNTHLPFKLDASGEQIGIFDNESTNYLPIDIFTFGKQTTDVSMARIPNGTGNFGFVQNPTPGIQNAPINIYEITDKLNSISIYPNPVTTKVTFQFNSQYFDYMECRVFNLTGNLIYKVESTNNIINWNIGQENISNGIYCVQITVKPNNSIKYINYSGKFLFQSHN